MKKIYIIMLLLGISVNATSKVPTNINELNMLCKLVQKGDLNAIKSMVEAGADINKKSKGKTPLMYAARYNKVDILKYLISKGAKLDTKCDYEGYTALKYAEISKAGDAYLALKDAYAYKKRLKRLKSLKKKQKKAKK